MNKKNILLVLSGILGAVAAVTIILSPELGLFKTALFSLSPALSSVLLAIIYRRLNDKISSVPIDECRLFWDFQMFNIHDHNKISKIKEFYYSILRLKYNPWFNPFKAYREIVWFIQRGQRGYADCDLWGLDTYLSKWLPLALTKLKKDKQGIPSSMLDPDHYLSEDKEKWTEAKIKWESILDKIILGFEAYNRWIDSSYEEELGPYPLERPSGLSADAWAKGKEDRHKSIEVLLTRDRGLFKEGMELFIEHFSSFWD